MHPQIIFQSEMNDIASLYYSCRQPYGFLVYLQPAPGTVAFHSEKVFPELVFGSSPVHTFDYLSPDKTGPERLGHSAKPGGRHSRSVRGGFFQRKGRANSWQRRIITTKL